MGNGPKWVIMERCAEELVSRDSGDGGSISQLLTSQALFPDWTLMHAHSLTRAHSDMCMLGGIHLYMHACTHTYLCVHTCTLRNAVVQQTCTHVCTLTHVQHRCASCGLVCVLTHNIFTCVHTLAGANVYTCICAHTHTITCVHTHVPSHARVHVCTYVCTHRHTYTA